MSGKRRGSLAAVMAAASVALPVYIHPTAPFLSIAGTPLSSLSVTMGGYHWSVIVGPALLLATLYRRTLGDQFLDLKAQPIIAPGTTILYWLAIVSLAGAILTPASGLAPILYTLQVALPATYLVVGMSLGSLGHTRLIARSFLISLAAYQSALIALNWADISAGTPHGVAAQFPQFLTYYPGLLALGGVAAWSVKRAHPFLALAYVLTLIVLLPTVWSRLGVAAICVGILAAALFSDRSKVRLGGLVLVGAFISGVFIVVSEGVVGDRVRAKGGDALESGRWEFMLGAADRILASPLFGDASIPTVDRGELGGYAEQGLRLYPAHSQLLDLGIRGGLPAIFLGIAVAAGLIAIARRIRRQGDDVSKPLGVGTIAVALFASFSDLYFAQALVASPIWLFVGLTAVPVKVPRTGWRHPAYTDRARWIVAADEPASVPFTNSDGMPQRGQTGSSLVPSRDQRAARAKNGAASSTVPGETDDTGRLRW